MAKSEQNAPVPASPTPAYLAYCEIVKSYVPAPLDFASWWTFSDRNTQVKRPDGTLEFLQD